MKLAARRRRNSLDAELRELERAVRSTPEPDLGLVERLGTAAARAGDSYLLAFAEQLAFLRWSGLRKRISDLEWHRRSHAGTDAYVDAEIAKLVPFRDEAYEARDRLLTMQERALGTSQWARRLGREYSNPIDAEIRALHREVMAGLPVDRVLLERLWFSLPAETIRELRDDVRREVASRKQQLDRLSYASGVAAWSGTFERESFRAEHGMLPSEASRRLTWALGLDRDLDWVLWRKVITRGHPWAENPGGDEELRRLERRAASEGDERAAVQLAVEQERRDGLVSSLMSRMFGFMSKTIPSEVIARLLLLVARGDTWHDLRSRMPVLGTTAGVDMAYAVMGPELTLRAPDWRRRELIYASPGRFTSGPFAGEPAVDVHETWIDWSQWHHGGVSDPHWWGASPSLIPFPISRGRLPTYGSSWLIPSFLIERWARLLKAGFMQPNPGMDETIRDLERRAAAGDPAAERELLTWRERAEQEPDRTVVRDFGAWLVAKHGAEVEDREDATLWRYMGGAFDWGAFDWAIYSGTSTPDSPTLSFHVAGRRPWLLAEWSTRHHWNFWNEIALAEVSWTEGDVTLVLYKSRRDFDAGRASAAAFYEEQGGDFVSYEGQE